MSRMTAEEIKALSYRELDALIAEKVFGSPKPQDWLDITWLGVIRGEWKVEVTNEPPGSMAWTARPYSTNPAASKALRDRMRELGWMFRMVYSGGLYLCQFANESGEFGYTTDTEERGWAEAAALATLGENT